MKLTQQEIEFIEKFIADYKAGNVKNYAIGWVSDNKCHFAEGGKIKAELQLYAAHFYSILQYMSRQGYSLEEAEKELEEAVSSFNKTNIKGVSGVR